jgi:hypothetical protein
MVAAEGIPIMGKGAIRSRSVVVPPPPRAPVAQKPAAVSTPAAASPWVGKSVAARVDGVGGASTRGVSSADWQASSNKTFRSAYLPASVMIAAGKGDLAPVDNFLSMLKGSEINGVVLDVKEGDGRILFGAPGAGAQIQGWNAGLDASLKRNTLKSPANLNAIIDRIHAKGMKVVARQVLFKDAAIVRSNPGFAIQDKTTGHPWGTTPMWVNPWNKDAQTYNIEIAKRALAAGADEIQFDYIRFPDHDTGDKRKAAFPGGDGEYHRAITSFLKRAHEEIKRDFPDRKIGADVFGYVASGRNQNDSLGQNLGEMAQYLDVIWPMQYPSHWAQDGQKAFGTDHPEQKPQEIYDLTTRGLIRQIGTRKDAVEIRPWVQAFTIKSFGGVKMTQPNGDNLGEYVRKQREGLKGADANGYALWGSVESQRKVLGSLRAEADEPRVARPPAEKKTPPKIGG